MSDKNFKEIILVVQGNGKIFPLFLCTALSASDMLDTAPLLCNLGPACLTLFTTSELHNGFSIVVWDRLHL